MTSLKPRRRARALSTTIAGLIVFTFLVIVLIPLFLHLFYSSTYTHSMLSTELSKKLAQSIPYLNTTLVESTSSYRIYDIKNTGSQPVDIAFYVLSDGNNTYLVKAPETFNKSFVVQGTLEIKTVPIKRAYLYNHSIRLSVPMGEVKVIVYNGYLLSIITSNGARSPINPGAGKEVTYAETAGSIKTNYVLLNNFTTIADLFRNGNDVILTTDPASNTPNRSILDSGVVESYCFNGSFTTYAGTVYRIAEGGFKPVNELDQVPLDAIYIQNIGPWIGTMIIGGKSQSYANRSIGLTLYIATYTLAAYNDSEPGIIMYKYSNSYKGICIDWIIGGSGFFTDCASPTGVANDPLASVLIHKHVLLGNETWLDTSSTETLEDTILNFFYSPSLGMVMYDKSHLIYCPDVKLVRATGEAILDIEPQSKCIAYVADHDFSIVWKGDIDPRGISAAIISLEQVFGNNNADSLRGQARVITATINIYREARPISPATYYEDEDPILKNMLLPDYPVVIKISSIYGDRDLLSVYDGYHNATFNGTGAFGVYYYSGYSDSYSQYHKTKYGTYERDNVYYRGDTRAYYYINKLYGEGGEMSVFTFVEGKTSGIRPFVTIADTDGNGLAELIFINEWFKPGPVSTIAPVIPITWWGTVIGEISIDKVTLYEPSDIYIPLNVIVNTTVFRRHGFPWNNYNISLVPELFHPALGYVELDKLMGCMETMMPEYVYMKFIGKYAVNGSKIAEVSVQIRYSFHDALGADTEEIDNPKNGVWGFFVADPNGSIVSSSVYIYQQLADLEDTWPPSTNFVSDSAYLPIPDKNALFYILYGFSDKYTYYDRYILEKVNSRGHFGVVQTTVYAEAYTEDLEYTVRIEWLGMWYLHR